jgi:hypothetical protein
MNRVNQERLLEENQLQIYRGQLATAKDSSVPETAAQQKSDRLSEKDHEISQLEDSLTTARARYSETHPDVQHLERLLAIARKQRDALLKEDQNTKPSPAPPRAASPQLIREQRDLAAAIERTQGMIHAKNLDMDDYREQAAQLDATIIGYESRLAGVPTGIKEYDELIRDRDLARKTTKISTATSTLPRWLRPLKTARQANASNNSTPPRSRRRPPNRSAL